MFRVFLLTLFVLSACTQKIDDPKKNVLPDFSATPDPLKLGGNSSCKVDEKKDCDTLKK